MLRSWRRTRSLRAQRTPESQLVRLGAQFQFSVLEDRLTPASLTVGPLENVSRMLGNQTEAAIAINPTNPLNIVAASNTSVGGGIQFYTTFDGGTNWSSRLIGAGQFGVSPCCDTEVVFDRFGNLFMVFLDFGLAGNTANVITSNDGGQNLQFVGTVLTDFALDQPNIAVGPGANPGTGSVWISARATNGIAATGATVSGLGGVGTFSAPTILSGSRGGNFGSVSVGPNGRVVVTYQNPSGGIGPTTIFTHLDPDGLGPLPFGPARIAAASNVGGFRPIPAQPNRTVDAEANTAYDNSGGPNTGKLYLVYTEAPNLVSSDLDIFLRVSSDDGVTWTNPVRVNDDATTNSQFFPGISVDQTTGNIAVGFYDCRNSPNNNTTDYYATVSSDGGATFLPNVRVSRGLSNGNENFIGDPNEFGDFYIIDFDNNVLRAIWADNSSVLPGNPSPNQLDIASAAVTFVPDSGGGNIPLIGTTLVGEDAGNVPLIRLYDLNTGILMGQVMAFNQRFRGGVRVAMGDVNGDGVKDLIAAAGPGGGPHVRVFDGVTFRQLLSPIGNFMAYAINFTGGVMVASGDVNGDGFDDVITGAGAGGGPHVRVFSGFDGHVLGEFMAYSVTFSGGVSVAVGDTNADGFADVITGAGVGGAPHVRVFSGASLDTMLLEFFAYDPNFRGGIYVTSADFNADGRADIVTGAGAGGGPHIRVFDGGTAFGLVSFLAFSNAPGSTLYVGDSNYLGGVRIAARDVDGDGLADIIVTPGAGGRPKARVFNGAGSQLYRTISLYDPGFLGGVFVS